MTPKQVLEAILMDLESCRYNAAHREQQAIKDGIKFAAIDCGAARAAFAQAIELIRSTGAQILHASDLTQQDEKETI